jgi:hypothetical protein
MLENKKDDLSSHVDNLASILSRYVNAKRRLIAFEDGSDKNYAASASVSKGMLPRTAQFLFSVFSVSFHCATLCSEGRVRIDF